jgi:hypothetical protein
MEMPLVEDTSKFNFPFHEGTKFYKAKEIEINGTKAMILKSILPETEGVTLVPLFLVVLWIPSSNKDIPEGWHATPWMSKVLIDFLKDLVES